MISRSAFILTLLVKTMLFFIIEIFIYKTSLVFFKERSLCPAIITALMSFVFTFVIMIDIIKGRDRSVSMYDRLSYLFFCLSHLAYMFSIMLKTRFAFPVENIPVIDKEIVEAFGFTNSKDIIEFYAFTCVTKELIDAYIMCKHPGFAIPMINKSRCFLAKTENFID